MNNPGVSSDLGNTQNRFVPMSDDEKTIKIMGRPSLPDCEKRHRVTVTLCWEIFQYVKAKPVNTSHFVEDAILEKILRTDPTFDTSKLTFIE